MFVQWTDTVSKSDSNTRHVEGVTINQKLIPRMLTSVAPHNEIGTRGPNSEESVITLLRHILLMLKQKLVSRNLDFFSLLPVD